MTPAGAAARIASRVRRSRSAGSSFRPERSTTSRSRLPTAKRREVGRFVAASKVSEELVEGGGRLGLRLAAGAQGDAAGALGRLVEVVDVGGGEAQSVVSPAGRTVTCGYDKSLFGVELRVEAHSSRLQHDEPSVELPRVGPNQGKDCLRKFPPLLARKANENHACRLHSGDVDESSEVLVFGQKDSGVPVRDVDDLSIRRPGRQVGNRDNVMAVGSECANDCKVAAFVRNESHSEELTLVRPLENESLLVGKRVGCVPQGGQQIGGSQPRVGVEEIFARGSLGELSQNQLHRDASSSDDWFPGHHSRVYFDSIRDGHRHTRYVVYWTSHLRYTR